MGGGNVGRGGGGRLVGACSWKGVGCKQRRGWFHSLEKVLICMKATAACKPGLQTRGTCHTHLPPPPHIVPDPSTTCGAHPPHASPRQGSRQPPWRPPCRRPRQPGPQQGPSAPCAAPPRAVEWRRGRRARLVLGCQHLTPTHSILALPSPDLFLKCCLECRNSMPQRRQDSRQPC